MYGEAGALQEAAAGCAGGWKPLFAARHAALKEAEPWLKPSSFEVEASLDMLAALPPRSAAAAAAAEGVSVDVKQEAAAARQAAAAAAAGSAAASAAAPAEEIQAEVEAEAELCIVFLVDGSGAQACAGCAAAGAAVPAPVQAAFVRAASLCRTAAKQPLLDSLLNKC